MEEKIKLKGLKYEAVKYPYDFQQYEMIKFSVDSIYVDKINMHEAEMDQTSLLGNMVKFNKSRPKTKESKDKKRNTFVSVSALYEG